MIIYLHKFDEVPNHVLQDLSKHCHQTCSGQAYNRLNIIISFDDETPITYLTYTGKSKFGLRGYLTLFAYDAAFRRYYGTFVSYGTQAK